MFYLSMVFHSHKRPDKKRRELCKSTWHDDLYIEGLFLIFNYRFNDKYRY